MKFNILFLTLLLSMSALGFADKECINSTYNGQVEHKIGPWGLFENVITIDKKVCDLTIEHQKYKMLKKRWTIDVCRMPIHIKFGVEGIDVYKRIDECHTKDKETERDFCKFYHELSDALQDDGLIFAPGIKEDLSSVHGKVFCTFQLIESYLGKGRVLASGGDVINPPAETPTHVPAQVSPTSPTDHACSNAGLARGKVRAPALPAQSRGEVRKGGVAAPDE